MGFNTTEMFPSKYLKAEEFGEDEKKIVTILDIRQEVFGQGRDAQTKFVLDLKDGKGFVMNKTNCAVIEKLYGKDTDEWIGKKITLFAMEVDSFGDIVRAIRVRPSVPSQAAQASTPAANAQTAIAAPQVGDAPTVITKEQKVLLVREADRVKGAGDGITFVREQLRDVNNASYQDAEQLLTWLKKQPDFKAQLDEDDSDPFGD